MILWTFNIFFCGIKYKKFNKVTTIFEEKKNKLLGKCLKLGTFEWDILNPDQLINLEINNKRRTSYKNPRKRLI